MPTPAAPRTPGYRFKDGRLMIFSEDEVMLIRGWDEPLAIAKGDDAWSPFVPDFRLVAPYRRAAKPAPKKAVKAPPPADSGQLDFDLFNVDVPKRPPVTKPSAPSPSALATQRKNAFDAFRFSMPKEVAKVLEHFRSHQWSLLVLLDHDRKFLDVATANPVLAYAIADWYADYPRSKLEFGKMPQRNLLRLLKLPDTAALVKLFRKIPPESVDRILWKPLLAGLRKPDGATSKLLAHVPSINLGMMELILTPHIHPALTPKLLEEVAADPKEKYRGTAAGLIRDIVAMEGELGDDYRLPAMTTVARIREIHADVSVEFQKINTLRKVSEALPLPPLPGIKGRVIPLCTQKDLIAEGREQRNCVATYTSAVISGKCYIYRVLHPSRATLSIRRMHDGNWGISELKASCNQDVPPETRAFVNEWLQPYWIGI
jgi:PcfJ-like protein